MDHFINLPLTKECTAALRAGDSVYLSGVIYTARDAAHKRIVEGMAQGQQPPFPLEGAVIYYVGPTPAQPGQAIGSAGPTTSYRMDTYAPYLLERGLMGMIGKGKRNDDVCRAMTEAGAVYLGAIGGAGALLSQCVTKSEVIAYDDLGAEAVHRLEVKDFPTVVLLDTYGGDLYQSGRTDYLATVANQ